MDAEKLNKALYDKMAAEQKEFRSWLVKQPPEEILNHTYQYSVRQDILIEMETVELPARQAAALLESPTPLADIYDDFCDIETGYMDIVRECVEERAKTMLEKQQETHRTTPIYQESILYAKEHGEIDKWRTSHELNIACRDAIDMAVHKGYDGTYLKPDVKGVLAEFGPERVSLVLAATIQARDWDERFSRSNHEWAAEVPMVDRETMRNDYALNSHSVLLDSFVQQARQEIDKAREQPAKKPSIKAQLSAKPVPGESPTKPKDREVR
ncbi:MAG: DUF3849 domain-containing protein [Oscillospiraceae bacterium]|nr:DUF3849 domain-containing protein [Oscillospiraceae bacterium]